MAVGRPLKFENVEALQAAIDRYFTDTSESEWTITGLALALDTSRETLMDYEHRDEFSDAVKRAKLKVENAYEKRNIKRGNGGDIFALKQFGWKDRREVDHTSKGERIAGFNFVSNGGPHPDNPPNA
jgi:hypothetical protein